MKDNYLNVAQILDKLRLRGDAFDNRVRSGDFPAPSILSSSGAYWAESVVNAWVKRCLN